MKVYVAGKWSGKENINEKIKILEGRGDTITHNWTTVEIPEYRTKEINRQFADWDIKGVSEAEVLIVDMTDPVYAYRGTWCEIGVALGQGIPVWLISSTPSTNVFYHSTGIKHFASWKDIPTGNAASLLLL
jgi:nucleoside 2-deoxyribosyltransferase